MSTKPCLLTFIGILFFSYYSRGTNYYISNEGYDKNDGKSPATPWKTIDQYNNSRALILPGDSILFKRGDKFIGKILHKSGSLGKSVVYAGYGTGAKPVITGAEPLLNWTSKGYDVYTMTSTKLYTHLFVNKKQITIARFPNKLYTPIASLSKYTIINNTINITGVNWKGATFHYRRQNDWIMKGVVTSHSGTSLTVDSSISELTVDHGFYLDNHLAALDIAYEWFQDKATKLITIKLPAGVLPSSLAIEGSYIDNGLDLNWSGQYVVAKGLEFRNFTYIAISGPQVKGIQILSCDFYGNNVHDIRLDGSNPHPTTDNIIDGNNFYDCNNTSLLINNGGNIRVTNNKVKRNSLIPGYEWPRLIEGNGMYLNMRNGYVGYNIIDSIGYSCMNISGDGNLIERNILSNHGLSKNDNGFIQFWGEYTHHNTIKENICFNGFGNTDGMPYEEKGNFSSNGIYFDDFCHDITIIGNTVYNSNNGIFIQSCQNMIVRDNITFDCKGNGLSIHEKNPFETFPEQSKGWIRDVKNITVRNNILFAIESSQNSYRVASSECPSSYDFGTSDSNYVINPYTHVTFCSQFRACNTWPVDPIYTLKTWQEYSKHELSSKVYKNIRSEYTCKLNGTELTTNGNFDQNVTNWSTYQTGVTATWVAQGGFNGGGLKLDNTTTNMGELSGPKMALVSGKKYLLKFSARTKVTDMLKVAFCKNSPYAPFFNMEYPVTTDIFNGEWLFTSNVTEPITKIQFFTKGGNTLWLDNISLQEVTSAIQDDINARSKLFVNTTNAEKIISLNGLYYFDINGNPVCGSIKLAPFRSMALIRDNNNTVCSTPKACDASGYITREQWNNVTGTTFGSIIETAPANSETKITTFESPQNVADNYVARIRGFICPPSSGAYTFWIASDDRSELYLSTNDSPRDKIKIAFVLDYTNSREWTKTSTQKSAPINLIEGQKYYIEALHKENFGLDNLAVGWDLPDGTQERPILGSRLSPFDSGGFTGTDEINFEKSTSVYPNPTHGVAYVHLTTETSEHVSISLHNLTGVRLKTFDFSHIVGSINVAIDISEFNSGTYYLEIKAGETRAVKKIVKL